MYSFLSAAYALVLAHGPAILAFLLLVLPTLITGLTPYPKAKGVLPFLQLLLNIVSVLTHRDSPGTFKAPLTISKPPDDGALVELQPKGFATLDILFAVFALAALAAAAVCAQEAPPPAPTRLVGGCNAKGTVCFGPSVALTMTAWDLTNKRVIGSFNPGVGYGVTFLPNRWDSFGLDIFLTMQTGPNEGIAFAVLGKFANGYGRIGIARQFLVGQRPSTYLPVGLGLDF